MNILIASKSSLKVWKQLDFEQQAEHRLEILAFDGLSLATASMTITVDNVNDNSLTSSQACFEARIPENEKDLDSLITVQGMPFYILYIEVFYYYQSHLAIFRKIPIISF